jgi:hypothetical protein
MGNHRETQMPSIKQKDQGYKPKSWVINKEVRFWGFVIVVTAAPATFAVKYQDPTKRLNIKLDEIEVNINITGVVEILHRGLPGACQCSLWERFFLFFFHFVRFFSLRQTRTSGRRTEVLFGDAVGQLLRSRRKSKEAKRSKGARMKTIQVEEETVLK